jgi:hypothetical protein
MYYNGCIDVGTCDYIDIGLRPLVLLPSGITLVKQENGTYNVQ